MEQYFENGERKDSVESSVPSTTILWGWRANKISNKGKLKYFVVKIGKWKFIELKGNDRRRKLGTLKKERTTERAKIWLYVTDYPLYKS